MQSAGRSREAVVDAICSRANKTISVISDLMRWAAVDRRRRRSTRASYGSAATLLFCCDDVVGRQRRMISSIDADLYVLPAGGIPVDRRRPPRTGRVLSAGVETDLCGEWSQSAAAAAAAAAAVGAAAAAAATTGRTDR